MLVREIIAQQLHEAVDEAERQGVLPSASLPSAAIERPQNPDHGDFASSLPLRLARSARMAPMAIAERLVPLISENDLIQEVYAAPPGFLNFRLRHAWLQQQVEAVLAEGDAFGNTQTGEGSHVQVEFVSVNPTGPVHVGHARGAVLGSALANVLAAAGHEVTREYYVNDAGTQMELFYASVYARYAQALGVDEEVPANGYQGDYMVDLGKELAATHGRRFLDAPKEQGTAELGQIGLEKMLDVIRADLKRVGVEFDVWFRERALYEAGDYDATMALLRERGYVSEREGAVWFTSTALGEDKDNVLVRSTGHPTYFASDVAYHRNKFATRDFDRVIDIWGADHQGHVPRMKAVMQALGLDPGRLTIIISQLVTLKRGGDIVRASKRTGEIVTLADLIDEVGPDACRYFFLARATDSQMEFDLELAKKESSDNPVYYVQYAHARISGILRQAEERNVTWSDGDVSLLTHEAELALIRKILLLPEIVDSIALTLAPHSLAHYASDLATAFHWFYDHCRVLSSHEDDEPLTKARLKLVQASRLALAKALRLMGMSAPENM